MVKVARRELRQAYLEADMGVTGANFAIADSGTIALITNEGNGRLVTTLPRVHVALVGFDKLVPDLPSALRILKALPRNATGQAISTYVTWITGATECQPGPNGRKEMHVVFLDNGRLALARDAVFSEVLRCIRCGACANVCPIYKLVGGHNYGHVYIGAIERGRRLGRTVNLHQYESSGVTLLLSDIEPRMPGSLTLARALASVPALNASTDSGFTWT